MINSGFHREPKNSKAASVWPVSDSGTKIRENWVKCSIFITSCILNADEIIGFGYFCDQVSGKLRLCHSIGQISNLISQNVVINFPSFSIVASSGYALYVFRSNSFTGTLQVPRQAINTNDKQIRKWLGFVDMIKLC